MRILSWILACALLAGCGGAGTRKAESTGGPPAAAGQTAPPAAEAVVAVAPATRDVRCGCSIESVGHCGNYIQIDGAFLEIANGAELGLGSMEWCGRSGVRAESAGEIRGGKFHATALVAQAP